MCLEQRLPNQTWEVHDGLRQMRGSHRKGAGRGDLSLERGVSTGRGQSKNCII